MKVPHYFQMTAIYFLALLKKSFTPVFGFRVMSSLGFKSRVGSALFALQRQSLKTGAEVPSSVMVRSKSADRDQALIRV